MAKFRAGNQAKESAWRRRVARQAGSGLSVRAWCRRHDLKEASFYWWRRELARREGDGPAPALVPVHLIGASAQGDDPQVEIVLTDGRRVRLTGPVDRGMLSEVLGALAWAARAEAERQAC